MLFDEDAILLSFFTRYSVEEDAEELKAEMLRYISKGSQMAPEIEGMSSPLDSGMADIKKRKRLAALANRDKENSQPMRLGVSGCDIGASPVMSGVFGKNTRDRNNSPLAQADKWKLG